MRKETGDGVRKKNKIKYKNPKHFETQSYRKKNNLKHFMFLLFTLFFPGVASRKSYNPNIR